MLLLPGDMLHTFHIQNGTILFYPDSCDMEERAAYSSGSPGLLFHAFTASFQYLCQSVPHLHDLQRIRYPFFRSTIPSITSQPQKGHGFAFILFMVYLSRWALEESNFRLSVYETDALSI